VRLPVRSNHLVKYVNCAFAQSFSTSLVGSWSHALDRRSTSQQRDTVEYLETAVAKWALYRRKKRIICSVAELRARVKEDHKAEVLGILVASARWFRGGSLAGFCVFRRTWCNNLAFDLLAVHPCLLNPQARQISGLGTALLYGISRIALQIEAKSVWGETTDSSRSFYASLFGLPLLTDILLLPCRQFSVPLQTAIEKSAKAR
jgi:hypothetical protein